MEKEKPDFEGFIRLLKDYSKSPDPRLIHSFGTDVGEFDLNLSLDKHQIALEKIYVIRLKDQIKMAKELGASSSQLKKMNELIAIREEVLK